MLVEERTFLATVGETMALGQVVNLMANDSNRLIDFMESVNGMLVVPIMLLTVLKLIYDMLGVAMFAGVSIP